MYPGSLIKQIQGRRSSTVVASLLIVVLSSLIQVLRCVDEKNAILSEQTSESLSGKDDNIQTYDTSRQQSGSPEHCPVKHSGGGDAETCPRDHVLEALDDVELTYSSSMKPLQQTEEKIDYSSTLLKEQDEPSTQGQGLEDDEEVSVSGNIISRSMQGLENMLGSVEKSSVRVFEKLGGVMDQVGLSREQMMKRLDTVMDRVSESVSESKVKVIQGFDSLMDKVSASRMKVMEEIDHVIDQVSHSKVMEDIRALPGEIRASFVLSVRNRSYVAAGVMVAITTAVLVAGAVYFTWCHHDSLSYYRVCGDESPAQVEHNSNNGFISGPTTTVSVAGTTTTVGVADTSNGHIVITEDCYAGTIRNGKDDTTDDDVDTTEDDDDSTEDDIVTQVMLNKHVHVRAEVSKLISPGNKENKCDELKEDLQKLPAEHSSIAENSAQILLTCKADVHISAHDDDDDDEESHSGLLGAGEAEKSQVAVLQSYENHDAQHNCENCERTPHVIADVLITSEPEPQLSTKRSDINQYKSTVSIVARDEIPHEESTACITRSCEFSVTPDVKVVNSINLGILAEAEVFRRMDGKESLILSLADQLMPNSDHASG